MKSSRGVGPGTSGPFVSAEADFDELAVAVLLAVSSEVGVSPSRFTVGVDSCI